MKGDDHVLHFAPEPTRPNAHMKSEGVVDILILTALQDELDGVRGLRRDWTDARDAKGFPYHRCAFDTGLVVAAAWIGAMGQTSAMARGKDLVHELRPECLAMCGICAGDPDQAALGDLIVADRLWPYDEGKQVQDKFYHSMKMVHTDRAWAMNLAYAKEWLDLTWLAEGRPPSKEAQKRWLLQALHAQQFDGGVAPADHSERKARCPGYANIVKAAEAENLVMRQGRSMRLTELGKDRVDEDAYLHPDGVPSEPPHAIHVGALATGSSVIKDGTVWGRLRTAVRETMAIDMEGASIAQLAEDEGKRFLVVKAVQDFANVQKDDTYRKFGCQASAKFVLAFLEKHLPPRIRVPPTTVVTANQYDRNDAEQSNHIVLCAPRSLQAAWQGVLPNGTKPQLLVLDTPEKQWYWEEPPDSLVWSSVFRGLEACADDLLRIPNRTLHIFALVPYGLGAVLGSTIVAPYRRRGKVVVYQYDHTMNAWSPWGPLAVPAEPGVRTFPIPAELTGAQDSTIRHVILVIRLSRMMDETEIIRTTGLPSDAVWIRATPDQVGPKAITTAGDVERLIDWLGKLVDDCGHKFPNASIHIFYAGPQAAFIRAGEHFALCGRPITIYDRNRAEGSEFRFLPVVRIEAGRAVLIAGERLDGRAAKSGNLP